MGLAGAVFSPHSLKERWFSRGPGVFPLLFPLRRLEAVHSGGVITD